MYYKGKTVWITGASSGIGAELARQFAMEGARVIISSHEAEELEGVKKQLLTVSTDVHTLVFNLGNPEEVQATAEKVLKEYGRVDVLMNNGGISTRAEAVETSLEIDRRIMEIDYFSGDRWSANLAAFARAIIFFSDKFVIPSYHSIWRK